MSGLSILSILLILTLICSTPTLEARKLLSMEKKTESALEDSLILTVLPKGRTIAPPSFPSGRGHAMALTEKLFKIHHAKLDRVLQSVPSPGVGH